MADIENENEKDIVSEMAPETLKEGAEEQQGETFARASLRDLVLDAGAALSDLTAGGEVMAAAEPTPLKSESVDEAKKSSKKRRKKEAAAEVESEAFNESVSESVNQAVASIAWSEEASEMDFVEENPLEALAKRMAETAAKKEESATEEEANLSESVAAPTEQMELGAFEEQLDAAEDDADDAPGEFIEQDQLLSVIESLLFATDRPVSVASIKQVFKGSNIRTKDITRALDNLASEYAAASRGVTLEEVNGGFQLRTKSDNAEFLRRLVKTRPFRLSGPALEVMSIVAYKQPITKHEIDEIRGVESGHLLRALMERGLVSFGEKSDLPGKPMTYETTRKFLETFGLRNIRELPTLREIDELLPEGIGEEEEKESLSDLTDQMSTELTSTYSEGQEELDKISEQLKAVDTTTEFFEQEKQRERERRDREKAQDIRERLVLGDAVEDKDRRWLERYEAKLNAPQEEVSQAVGATAVEEPSSDEESPEAVALAALSAEESSVASEAEESAEDMEDVETAEDLTAYQDWDEDSEQEV